MCLLCAYTTRLVSGWPMPRGQARCGVDHRARAHLYRCCAQKCGVFVRQQSLERFCKNGDRTISPRQPRAAEMTPFCEHSSAKFWQMRRKDLWSRAHCCDRTRGGNERKDVYDTGLAS